MKRILPIMLLFLLFGCSSQPKDQPVFGQPFEIKLNEVVSIDGIQIEFADVLEDSRCIPIKPGQYIACFSEGHVKIQLDVKDNSEELGSFEFSSRGGTQVSSPQYAGNHSIVLLGVNYTPSSKEYMDRSLYSVTLLVNRSDFSSEPMRECVECQDGKTWNDKPCCTGQFEADCNKEGGIVRWTDLHPLFTVLRECVSPAPDAGKACSSDNDCVTGICDLQAATKSCTLVKKEPNQYAPDNDDFYAATYSCNTTTPGKCSETVWGRTNPGGISRSYTLNGTTLTENAGPGPIN